MADRWMAVGPLRGPANVGDGYLLELLIPLSGEEGDVLLGQLDQEDNSNKDLLPSHRGQASIDSYEMGCMLCSAM